MTEEFTLEISACGPIKQNDERGQVIINFGPGSSTTLYLNTEECICDCPDKLKDPPKPYNLKECPNPKYQKDIFAWDCETSFEAESEGQAAAHDNAVRPDNSATTYPQRPAWVGGCKRCIECEEVNLGERVISAYRADKFFGNCGTPAPSKISPGRRIDASVVRSEPFYEKCLEFYDVYAKVNVSYDNWGYIKDVNGPASTTKCDNEDSNDCTICAKNEEFGPLNPILAGADLNPYEAGMLEVGAYGWAINAPHGGPVSIGTETGPTVIFYFKPKPKIEE